MKKLFDRRMVGYLVGVFGIVGLAVQLKIADPSMAMNMILGMFGILVGGNVVQAIKEPRAKDASQA